MDEDDKPVFEDESTDFYDEFKDRMRQDPLKSVLTKRTQQSRPTGGVITVLIAVVLAALVIWYIVEKYFSAAEPEAEMAPPVIQADEAPVKVRPENIGGMAIAGKDKTVYNRIGQGKQQPPERIIRREEVPSPVVGIDDGEDYDDEDEYGQEVTIVRDKVKAQEAAPPIAVEPTLPKALADNAASVPPAPVNTDDGKKAKAVPIYTPPQDAVPVLVATPAPAAEKAFAPGKWKVQILSSRDRVSVAKSWENIKSKNPDLVGELSHEITEADLGERGIFYRLRVGEFADRKDADELCRQLKSRKLDCLVVK